jgi:RHS repeat-associated protein
MYRRSTPRTLAAALAALCVLTGVLLPTSASALIPRGLKTHIGGSTSNRADFIGSDISESRVKSGRNAHGGGEVTTGRLDARNYLPELGQFDQPEPLVVDPTRPGAFAPYAYAMNDPVNFADRDGERVRFEFNSDLATRDGEGQSHSWGEEEQRKYLEWLFSTTARGRYVFDDKTDELEPEEQDPNSSFSKMLARLIQSDEIFTILLDPTRALKDGGGAVYYPSTMEVVIDPLHDSYFRPPGQALVHEAQHALDHLDKRLLKMKRSDAERKADTAARNWCNDPKQKKARECWFQQ